MKNPMKTNLYFPRFIRCLPFNRSQVGLELTGGTRGGTQGFPQEPTKCLSTFSQV